MTDPREIAAKLTKEQREALLFAHKDDENTWVVPAAGILCSLPPWPQGMVRFSTVARDRLTPLGLAVRAVLMEAGDE